MSKLPFTDREVYSDFFTTFLQNPINSDIAKKSNEQSIKQSIRNLILTRRGERLFQPELGSDVADNLFELFVPQMRSVIEESIKDLINNYEPRASVIEVNIDFIEERNQINISIVFITNNLTEPTTLSIILDRER